MLGALAVTTYVNPLFLVPVVLMAGAFVFTRRAYLRVSQSIKRLEGSGKPLNQEIHGNIVAFDAFLLTFSNIFFSFKIAKSPIYTHLAATLNGLPTIRAHNAQTILKEEFDYHQDTHSACWFMFITTSSAFGFSMDVMCFLFVCCVIYFYMVVSGAASGDQIGLAITQALSITTMLQWGVRQSAEVSNQLMAVERVLEYCGLEPEPEPKRPQPVAKEWPSDGAIEFRNIVYRYFAEAEPVLQNLSLVIRSKEKIGIVGRTGAGTRKTT